MRVFNLTACCLVTVLTVGHALAQPAENADALLGTWKLDVSKSTYSGFEPPRELVETYRVLANGEIERTVTGISADGAADPVVRMTWPRRGGVIKGLDRPDTYIETYIGPGEWLVTSLLDGVQVSTRHKIVAADGRTMTQAYHGIEDGKPISSVEVWTRQ
jgi:hypothetical protein